MSKRTCIKNQQGLCLYVKNIRGGNVKNTIPTKKHGEKFAGTVLLSCFCGVLLQWYTINRHGRPCKTAPDGTQQAE